MAKTVHQDQDNWDDNISLALFAYRSAVHESTGFIPFMLKFGRTPTLPLDVMLGTPLQDTHTTTSEYVASMRRKMSTMFSSVRENVKSPQKHIFDGASKERNLDIGDHVWPYVPAVRVGSTRKFASLW